MREIAPHTELKSHRRNRPGILGAAIGLTSQEDSKLGSSSNLNDAEEVKDRLEEGMKRAEKMREIAPQTEAKHHHRTRPGIVNAAIGIKMLDESDSDQEMLDQKLNNALARAEKIGAQPNKDGPKNRRGKIRSSIVGSSGKQGNNSIPQDEKSK